MKTIKSEMNKNKNKTLKIVALAGLIMAGLMHCGAMAQSTMVEPLPATMSTGSNSFIGTFYAYVRGTNISGGIWLAPSNGVQSCTVMDTSGLPSPYASSLVVTCKNGAHTYSTNQNCNLIFPTTNTSYSIMLYVNSVPPPPTNGQPLTLQIVWSTNALTTGNTN